jgi:hypothetical protein
LKVLSEWDEHILGLLEICLVGYSSHVHSQSDGKVKGIERSFISDDEGMLFKREFGEIDRVFWGSEEIEKLAQFSLIRRLPVSTLPYTIKSATLAIGKFYLMEEFEEVDIVFFIAKVLFQEEVNCSFEHERIVYGDRTDVGLEANQDCLQSHP